MGDLWGVCYQYFGINGLCYNIIILYNLERLVNKILNYMRRWTGSAIVQIMACWQHSAKPLSEPMLTYCQWDPKEYISMKFYLQLKYFHSRKWDWTCRLWYGDHFVQGEMSELYHFHTWVMSVLHQVIDFRHCAPTATGWFVWDCHHRETTW